MPSTPASTDRLTDPRGRSKAYRPMPASSRAVALASFVHAYDAGDFFEAHEILEPAWMGSPDQAERELLQGLIKLAAAFVHGQRGNPAGVAKNLRGARDRLLNAAPGESRLDVSVILAAIDDRLRALERGVTRVEPIPLKVKP